jgi:RB1-inducible coiled-coil protein 1
MLILCLTDVDLQTQIDASLAMPATYQTVCARAHLAQQCCGLAREQTKICERLVHDQHLQQQGWAAVVANLEDITQMFQSRAEQFQQAFVLYLAERQQHMELLDKYNHFSILSMCINTEENIANIFVFDFILF